MKKLLLSILCSILILSGCNKSEKQVDYAAMDFEQLYEELEKNDSIYIAQEKIDFIYQTKKEEAWFNVDLNLFEEIDDDIAKIFFRHKDIATDEYYSGIAYLSDPMNPYVSLEDEKIEEDAKSQMTSFLSKTWGLSDEEFHEFVNYIYLNYGMDETERTEVLASQREKLVDNQKVTTSVCLYESENGSDNVTMVSSNGNFIDSLSWTTTFKGKDQAVLDYLTKEKESYQDIRGAEYTIEETDDAIVKKLQLALNFLNEDDLADIGLISGSSLLPLGVSLEPSIENFEKEGYTCTSIRE